MFHHKNIRLRQFNYVGQQCYFLTLCCFDRRPVFADPKQCAWLLEEFRAESAGRSFAIHAYCIMPGHFHFLTEGQEPSSDLLAFVKSFKIKTSRLYQAETSQTLWQKKFFDHILRTHESIELVAWYIWLNPVRKGLSTVVGEYPFAGSFTETSKRITSMPSAWIPPWKSNAPASEGGRYNPG
ncbi:MAG TPA: transposase [Candidatus Acidoferrum sp.]|nr:transposase [Candidatus Acidoferrum sp.]